MRKSRMNTKLTVEMLETKVLPSSATAAAVLAGSGGGAAVVSQGYRAVGQNASANLVLQGGGQRFVDSYRLVAVRDRTSVTAVGTDPYMQFSEGAAASLAAGASTGGVTLRTVGNRTILSETIVQDGYRYIQTATITSRNVRGQANTGSTTLTNAFDALTSEIDGRRTYTVPATTTYNTPLVSATGFPRAYGVSTIGGGLGHGPNPGITGAATGTTGTATTGSTISGVTTGGVAGTGTTSGQQGQGTGSQGLLGGGSATTNTGSTVGTTGGTGGTGPSGTGTTGTVVTTGGSNTTGFTGSIYGPTGASTVGTASNTGSSTGTSTTSTGTTGTAAGSSTSGTGLAGSLIYGPSTGTGAIAGTGI